MGNKRRVLILLILALFGGNAGALDDVLCKYTDKNTILLNGEEWELYFGPQNEDSPTTPMELLSSGYVKIAASVPGNVEIDMYNAGVIDDPQFAANVYKLRPFEYCQWWYHRRFPSPSVQPGERVELCFDGIDCIADIWLNDQKIASVDNMLIEHHFDVTNLLSDKGNELYVCIKSTELELRKNFRNDFGVRSDLRALSCTLRKAPHMFGWDIMPRVISAGLWKDVKLEVIPPTYFQGIYWATKNVRSIDEDGKGDATMLLDWQFMTDRADIDNCFLDVRLSRKGRTAYSRRSPLMMTCGTEEIELKKADLWWPAGFGEAALYDAQVRILDERLNVLAENDQKIGIRTVKLAIDQLHSKGHKGRFRFMVNGEPVFIKGTNWVPMDALHSRDKERIPSAMDMIVDLNCNMIRCWGGNVYEDDLFYDLCDQNGVLVWQDFALACTLYPQDRTFQDKLREEAVRVILRLRNHPSMALWAGGNETDVSFGWGHLEFINPNVELITRNLLPSAVREYDPHRDYLPNSPYISDDVYKQHNSIDKTIISEAHLWGPRGFYKDPFYTGSTALFTSEIGYHGCPDKESLKRMMGEEYLYPWKEKPSLNHLAWNEAWQCKACVSHPNSDKNTKRNDLLYKQIHYVFNDVPLDLDDFILASQMVQSEAMKFFIEFWRMNKGERNGILWWNLRDGWPILSDAVVDYYNGKKLAYTTIKHVQTDVCVMISEASDGRHSVIGVNDTRKDKTVKVKIVNVDGKKTLLEKTAAIPANGKLVIGSLPQVEGPQFWLISYEAGGQKLKNHYISYRPPLRLSDCRRWLKYIKD